MIYFLNGVVHSHTKHTEMCTITGSKLFFKLLSIFLNLLIGPEEEPATILGGQVSSFGGCFTEHAPGATLNPEWSG